MLSSDVLRHSTVHHRSYIIQEEAMTVFTLGETHCANCSRLILPGEEFAHGAGDFTHSPECPIAVSDIHQQLLDVLNDYHRAEYNADSGTVVSLLPYADRLERLISQTVSSQQTKLLERLSEQQLIYYQHVYDINPATKTESAVPVSAIEAERQRLLGREV